MAEKSEKWFVDSEGRVAYRYSDDGQTVELELISGEGVWLCFGPVAETDARKMKMTRLVPEEKKRIFVPGTGKAYQFVYYSDRGTHPLFCTRRS